MTRQPRNMLARQPARTAPSRRVGRAGLSFLYVVVIMAILMVFVAFAVDVGRMRLARTQLQSAADASARAGVSGLPLANSSVGAKTAIDRAQYWAEQNACLGDAIAFDRINDIDIGQWDRKSRTFTVLPSDRMQEANAVRCTARRIASRGNPIKLYFAPVVASFDPKVNPNANDIQTPSVAYIMGGPVRNAAVVGLQYVRSNGNTASVDSYISPNYNPQNPLKNGSVVSNGDIDLGNADVSGDVRPGVNGDILNKKNSEITGWMAPLDTPVLYPPAKLPTAGYTTIDKPKNNKDGSGPGWQWASDELTLTGSSSPDNPNSFYLDADFSPSTVTITGYAALYVRGNVDLEGKSIGGTLTDPRKFQLYVLGSHTVDIGGNAQQAMVLYAPESSIKLHGGVQFFGSMVGKSVEFLGTANIHYDERLNSDPRPFRLALVK